MVSTRYTRDRAFSLIELLVVVSIIAALAALMIAGLTYVRERARELTTQTRMQDVLRLVQASGLESAGAAFHLSNKLGLLSADRNEMLSQLKTINPNSVPFAQALEDSVVFVDGNGPPDFAFEEPWQRDDSRTLADSMTPALSFVLLLEAGLLPANDPQTPGEDEPSAAYFTDRGPDRPWNDAWGGPLVVAYQLFQPQTRKGLAEARQRWGYSRSLYVSVAAAGPSFAEFDDSSANFQVPQQAWDHVQEALALPSYDWSWSGADFRRSQDEGIKIFRGSGPTVMISTPSEMR